MEIRHGRNVRYLAVFGQREMVKSSWRYECQQAVTPKQLHFGMIGKWRRD